MSLKVSPLRDDLPYGARVHGVTEAILQEEHTHQQLRALFQDRGLILFEEVGNRMRSCAYAHHVPYHDPRGLVRSNYAATDSNSSMVLRSGVSIHPRCAGTSSALSALRYLPT